MSKPAQPSWGHSTVDTACVLDCPDSCSLAVTVERGRVTRIDGSTRNRVTKGFICAKVRRFDERIYGADRLEYPAIRKGPKGKGQFARVTWDEAMHTIAEKLRETRERFGGEAILPLSYGGSNGLLTQDTTDADLFAGLGASRLARTVCAAPTGAAAQAMYGKMVGVGYQDFVHARLIIVWGANPSASGVHLVPYIREAQRNGAKLVVVDPRRTPLAKTADLHVQLRPGTDLPVALAIHRMLFEDGRADLEFLRAHATGVDELRRAAEPWTFDRAAAEAGVDPEHLRTVAEWYATTSPALVRCGWGLERNRNGGHAVMAVLALPAVAGKFGVRGGGYTLSNSKAFRLDASRWRQVPDASTRIVNMNQVGRILSDETARPIKALFVYNCNPVATLPHQNAVIKGLMRNDLFTVVYEQVMTDTAAFADVILPAPTFLEGHDLAKGYGAISLQLTKPVIDLVGEARPNSEVFSELAERLQIGDIEAETDVETLMRVTATLAEPVQTAILGGEPATPPEGDAPVQFDTVFPDTPDRKVALFPPDLPTRTPGGLYGYHGAIGDARFPLTLISPATEKTISSTLGELRKGFASAYMHVDDAAERGVEAGDAIRIFNELGEVQCAVTIGDAIARGTVSLAKGLWRRHTLNGSTATALAPDTLTDIGDGACFNDARVQVAKILAVNYESLDLALFVPAPHEQKLH
ncbi:MAG: molybdopterin-dependent oxidoreductase [Vicinamibacterales bacterium]